MTLKTGDNVIFIDSIRKEHNALVTAIHGDPENKPAINLVYVSDDTNEQDPYGRQLKRETSMVNIAHNSAKAHCWAEFPQ